MSVENAPEVAGNLPPAVTNTPATPTPTPETTAPEVQESQTRTFTQEDVDKIVAKRLSKAERTWERRHTQLLETVVSRGNPTPAPAPSSTSTDEEPDPAKYENYTDYLRDLTRYTASQAVAKTSKKAEEQQQQQTAQQRAATVQANLNKRMAAASEKYDDFEDVVMSDDLPISPAMAEIIAESDLGGELAYHLGKNKAEAARIAALSPLAAARAMGLIEAKLAAAPAPEVSKAPEPPTPVGNRSAVSKDPDKMSVEEWREWREGQIKKRRQA